MNTFIVTRLILKDWYLNRGLLLAAIITGLLTMAAVAAARGTTIALILGVVVLATVLIGMGAMIMSSTVNERKQQTLPFVMSLPVSYLEYTTSKLVGSLIIFSLLWLTLLLGMIATILLTPWFPHGLIPFVVIMSGEILMSTSLVAAVAVSTESEGWNYRRDASWQPCSQRRGILHCPPARDWSFDEQPHKFTGPRRDFSSTD